MTTTESTLTRFTGILASVGGLDTLRERLCEASRILLGADGVVVTCESVPDGRTVVCWTQLMSRRLESLQDLVHEGPVLDALVSGRVVAGDFDAGNDDTRWPLLRERLADLGFTGSLLAIPLQSDLALRGVLLAHRDAGSRGTDAEQARFLAIAIGTAVLQDPSIGAQSHVMAEILIDREIVHAATGILQTEAAIRYEDALALLRALAFSRGEHLGTVAKAVIAGEAGLGLHD